MVSVGERALVADLYRTGSPLARRAFIQDQAEVALQCTPADGGHKDRAGPAFPYHASRPERSRAKACPKPACEMRAPLGPVEAFIGQSAPSRRRLHVDTKPPKASGQVSFGLGRYSTPIGTYVVCSLQVNDAVGNYHSYTVSELQSLGFPTQFTVAGTHVRGAVTEHQLLREGYQHEKAGESGKAR